MGEVLSKLMTLIQQEYSSLPVLSNFLTSSKIFLISLPVDPLSTYNLVCTYTVVY